MTSQLESSFKSAIDSKGVPGVAAVVLDKSGDVLFKHASGSTNADDPNAAPYTSSTPAMMWSCTKVVACVAALQLVEQGKLKLDDEAEKYVPAIAKIQVLEGFKEDGEPILRAPKTKPTILNLMTHTAGFSYDFFHEPTLKWRTKAGQQPAGYVAVGNMQCFESPLQFDPGSQYMYGINIDWLGFVVEAVSGLKLQDYIKKNILDPLGLKKTGTHVDASDPRLVVHLKGEDGKLTAAPDLKAADAPEVYGGGHYLYSTLDDYSQFLLALLNNGTNPKTGGKILNEDTVKKYLFEDFIPQICSPDGIGAITDVPMKPLSNEGEFMPGVKKGWSCGLMINNDANPKGRSAGSGAWAGLGNNYFWVDPKAGKTGLIMSSILPFLDQQVLDLFNEMEAAVYAH